MLAYLRLETVRAGRSPAFLGYTMGFPIGFYLLLTTVFSFGPPGDSSFAAYYMVSMGLYGSMGVGLLSVGARIANERTRGWTRQLALSPLRPGQYVAVKVLSAALLSLPVVIAIMIAGRLVNDVSLPAATWVSLFPIVWVGGLPFAALGVAIGYTFRDEIAQMASMSVYFLMAIAGGLWMPVMLFPDWLESTAHVLPTYQIADIAWRILDGEALLTGGVAIAAAWSLGFVALAGWRYRQAS